VREQPIHDGLSLVRDSTMHPWYVDAEEWCMTRWWWLVLLVGCGEVVDDELSGDYCEKAVTCAEWNDERVDPDICDEDRDRAGSEAQALDCGAEYDAYASCVDQDGGVQCVQGDLEDSEDCRQLRSFYIDCVYP
jgi:hypothetical protein